MRVAALVVSDGRRDCLRRTLDSLVIEDPSCCVEIVARVLVNDSLDPEYGAWLERTFPFDVLHPTGGKRGFAGAVQAGWDAITEVDAEYVLHVEDDFEFLEPVQLERMLYLLERQSHLAQVALKRQPWNGEEIAAGGIVEQHPHDFTERADGEAVWTEHRRFFTTNPSVYSSRLCRLGWPQEPQSEGLFTHRLLADPHVRFAFWGGKFDAPRVRHIGAERAGTGY